MIKCTGKEWREFCASMQQYSPDRYRRELEAM